MLCEIVENHGSSGCSRRGRHGARFQIRAR
ncbi:hypothetical protein OIU76_003472 [Salix suchowensis]|nr:hypothetical protein OIU76_003472 [Salix suchowensis]